MGPCSGGWVRLQSPPGTPFWAENQIELSLTGYAGGGRPCCYVSV